MAVNIQALREQRSARAKELHKLLDENPSEKWGTAQQEKYDAGMAEIKTLDDEITRHQRLMDEMAKEFEAEQVIDKTRQIWHDKKSPAAAMFEKWVRGGDKALSAEDWMEIRNTLSTTTGSQGGYSVQSDVAARLIEMLKAYGGVREVAELLTTEMGNPLSFPTSDGTSETGELIAENTTATSADPTFGTVAVNAYKFSSKVVAVPIELLQDSQIDIEAFLENRLAERIGRITNTYFTTGTGTSQPRGIVTGASAGKVGTTGQTTTVIFDDLVDLKRSVNRDYRRSPKCGWMLSDTSMGIVEKLKDTNGRPIYLPGYDGLGISVAETLMGFPVTINDDVPDMAANAKSILFGDMGKYIVRDVMQAQLFRFDDSAYVKLGQIGFLMWARSGGNLTDTTAVKYYQNSAT